MIDADARAADRPARRAAGSVALVGVLPAAGRRREADLALMRRIDELHLDHPFAGARMLRDLLRQEGFAVGRKHVATLMRHDGHRGAVPEAQHQPAASGASDLSVSAARADHRAAEPGLGDGHHLHPDGAWLRLSGSGAGLGHPPVLAWRLSISMSADFCVEALEEAIAKYGAPEIMNTDQGSQCPTAWGHPRERRTTRGWLGGSS